MQSTASFQAPTITPVLFLHQVSIFGLGFKTSGLVLDHKEREKERENIISRMDQKQIADDSRVDFQKQKKQGAAMCEEEWRIRGELESEIERELEEEIKEGIYHLAFRLHRLYQHKRDKTLSEVNISVKMEVGTRIEIKESKKDQKGQPVRRRTMSSRSKGSRSNAKKFDWANSLRTGGADHDPAILNRKTERSYQAKLHTNNDPKLENTRRKGNMGVNNKLLELGWKW